MLRKRLDCKEYFDGIMACSNVILSKAITLVESTLDEDQLLAQQLIELILPYTGKSIRIGITGVPGVGKSTFIEAFGNFIIKEKNKKIAILAVDPSSQLTKGSIMGDKTRMDLLSNNQNAFIRPSPSGKTLGGVNKTSRETILLCEAAGYEVILIETVGVGQAEIAVKSMTDFFLLLMLAGAGDELQGIKKGIIEMADLIAITKADGDNIKKARTAKVVYENALHYLSQSITGWSPHVLTCSALQSEGIKQIWEEIEKFIGITNQNGAFNKNRNFQNLQWMYDSVKQNLENNFYKNYKIKDILPSIESEVINGSITSTQAALKLLKIHRNEA